MYRVMVLDEDRSARYIFARFPWERYGFEAPAAAASGRQALERLAEEPVDLLVADIRLPDMDGLDFLTAVRQRQDGLCTVLLSTYRDFSYVQQGIPLGVFDYLTKPFTMEAFSGLLQRVEIYLRRQRGVPEKLVGNGAGHYPQLAEQEKSLEALLFAGSPDFLPACRQFQADISLPAEQRRLLLASLMDKLTRAFDFRFPWVKNLADPANNEMLRRQGFIEQAASLASRMERYELAQEHSLLRRICQQVQQTLEQDVSLHGVAASLGISADYAGRLFKRRTGVNFATFVMRMKMERGKALLAQRREHNYEISARLGYSNPDYFRQLFKNYTGMTPTEYRNLHRPTTFHC